MATSIDKDRMERLVALGKRQGGELSIDDLRRALPIDSMDTDEIALVVKHLEEQGVDVGLEGEFLLGRDAARHPVRLPPADPALAGGDTTGPAERSSSSLTWDSVAPQGSASSALLGGDPLAERAIMIAGLFVVVVLGLVIAIAA